MNPQKQYLIDDKQVTYEELIERGKDAGYDGDMYGVFYTSGAAKVLRSCGHTVRENPDYRKEETL